MQPANSGLTPQQWLGAQEAMRADIERARQFRLFWLVRGCWYA